MGLFLPLCFPPTEVSLAFVVKLDIFCFFKIFLKIHFFIHLFLAALGLRCCVRTLLWLQQAGAALPSGAWASHCGGFPCCGAWALGAQASVVVRHVGLVALRHVGSSRTRGRTRVPCIGRQILNHCATREALARHL